MCGEIVNFGIFLMSFGLKFQKIQNFISKGDLRKLIGSKRKKEGIRKFISLTWRDTSRYVYIVMSVYHA